MDQIHYIPQAGNQKKKGGKVHQGRLLRLRPRPSAAEDKGNDRTRPKAEDMLKRARRVSSGVFAACPPGPVPPEGLQQWGARGATVREDSEAEAR